MDYDNEKLWSIKRKSGKVMRFRDLAEYDCFILKETRVKKWQKVVFIKLTEIIYQALDLDQFSGVLSTNDLHLNREREVIKIIQKPVNPTRSVSLEDV